MKVVLAMIGLSSGMVTSAIKEALFVQSGELVGMGVSGVEVAPDSADGVSVAVGALVAVDVATRVSVVVGVTVSTGARAPQAEVINTIKRKITSDFFLMETPSTIKLQGRQSHYIQKAVEKPYSNKINPVIHP